MALSWDLKQNPRVCVCVAGWGPYGHNFNLQRLPVLSDTSWCLTLWLYSDSPCTASTRPPILKQTAEYWLSTLPANDSLVGSRELVCVEWILQVESRQPRLDPFSCCQGKPSEAAWTPARAICYPGRPQLSENPLYFLRHGSLYRVSKGTTG